MHPNGANDVRAENTGQVVSAQSLELLNAKAAVQNGVRRGQCIVEDVGVGRLCRWFCNSGGGIHAYVRLLRIRANRFPHAAVGLSSSLSPAPRCIFTSGTQAPRLQCSREMRDNASVRFRC